MKQDLPLAETIERQTKFYDLKITYQPPLEPEIKDENEKIEINLKVNSESKQECYRQTLTNANVPHDVIATFSGLDIVFDCFREQNWFQIDLKNGNILLKGTFEIKGRKIQKQSLIQLEKYQITEYDSLFQQIQRLQAQVTQLKQTKFQRDQDLRKQYEQKFSQEREKFIEALALFKQQQEKERIRQKNMETYTAQLEKRLLELAEKINQFSEDNVKQIEELKMRSELCREEIKKAKNELEDTFLFKKGHQGRKMRKPNASLMKQKRMSVKTNIEVPSYIEENCLNLKAFSFSGNQITYIGKGGCQKVILFKKQIPKIEYHFEFKIIRTVKQYIVIGIAEKKSFMTAKYCNLTTNSIGYCGKTGFIWGGNLIVGDGFKEGDVVHVSVELCKPYIEWKVNGAIQASFQPTHLKTDEEVFVPFVEMEDKEDCVEWCEV